MTHPSQFRKIPLGDLRNKFAAGRYLERLKDGELRAKVLAEHPPSPTYHQPKGTKSQKIGYFDRNGIKVAEVHQYLLPDGSIGASGIPDPLRIFDLDSRTVYLRED